MLAVLKLILYLGWLIIFTIITNVFELMYFQDRNKKIEDATELMLKEKISVSDFLNRMVYQDDDFVNGLNAFDSVGECEDENVEFSDIDDSSDSEEASTTAVVPAGRCTICAGLNPLEIVVVPCGHLSCQHCWKEWTAHHIEFCDKKYDNLRTRAAQKKKVPCFNCRGIAALTTKVFI